MVLHKNSLSIRRRQLHFVKKMQKRVKKISIFEITPLAVKRPAPPIDRPPRGHQGSNGHLVGSLVESGKELRANLAGQRGKAARRKIDLQTQGQNKNVRVSKCGTKAIIRNFIIPAQISKLRGKDEANSKHLADALEALD